MRLVLAFGFAWLVGLGHPSQVHAEESWATTRARELVSSGTRSEAGGQTANAIEMYRRALEIDATYEPAYAALGSLRERLGDPEEAERTYAAAIDHVLAPVDVLVSRARLRARTDRVDDAMLDLQAALRHRPSDPALWRTLATTALSHNRLPIALAAYRRLAMLERDLGNIEEERAARVKAIAIARVVGEADPAAGGAHLGEVRRIIAQVALAPMNKRR